MGEFVPVSKNWEAFLELELRCGEDKTHLIPIKRYGPLSVQRPFYPEQACCHVYLLHPPGGVVGGDKLAMQFGLKPGTRSLFTTPGANKFYRSAADFAQVRQDFEVDGNSHLEFLPQENIYFPGARVRTRTSIKVDPGARVMLWEKHCFGRPSNRELFASGQVISEIELYDREKLIFTEKHRVDADELRRDSGLRNYPVTGSFLIYGSTLEKTLLDKLRKLSPLDGVCGLTQFLPELTIARYLGNSTRDIDAYFVRLWELLRPTVMQRTPSHPRIWKT